MVRSSGYKYKSPAGQIRAEKLFVKNVWLRLKRCFEIKFKTKTAA